MKNFKIRLSAISTVLILIALVLGWLGPWFAQNVAEQMQKDEWAKWAEEWLSPTGVLMLAAFVFVGFCFVLFHGLLERALSPIMALTDTFLEMRAYGLNPRLPVEGPEEMQQMAHAFNEMMSNLGIQIRDVSEEKHEAERNRQYLVEQLSASERFMALVDSAPIGIVLADSELNVVYQNAVSESGFLQLTSFLFWNAEVVVGRSLALLYPDDDAAREILSDPDRLPYETHVPVGPYHLRFLAGPVYNSEGDYVGPVLMWEVVDTHGKAAEEEGAEPEVQQAPSTNGTALAVAGRLKRGAMLVGRSVRFLSDQLSTITSMVEALCNEGDSLRRSLEETQQRTQNAAHLTAERSEALWELVNEMNGMGERTRASVTLIKRLRKSLKDAGTIPSAIARMAGSIEHMVVEARLEVGRSGEAGAGMKVVVDEIRKVGRESTRLNKNVGTKLERIRTQVDDMVALLEEDRREVRGGGRLARRAESALGRVERDLNDVDERTDLLAEMAVGQSEIGTHIADQLVKLAEVVDVTLRVAKEQVRLVQESLGEEGKGVAVEEEA